MLYGIRGSFWQDLRQCFAAVEGDQRQCFVAVEADQRYNITRSTVNHLKSTIIQVQESENITRLE